MSGESTTLPLTMLMGQKGQTLVPTNVACL